MLANWLLTLTILGNYANSRAVRHNAGENSSALKRTSRVAATGPLSESWEGADFLRTHVVTSFVAFCVLECWQSGLLELVRQWETCNDELASRNLNCRCVLTSYHGGVSPREILSSNELKMSDWVKLTSPSKCILHLRQRDPWTAWWEKYFLPSLMAFAVCRQRRRCCWALRIRDAWHKIQLDDATPLTPLWDLSSQRKPTFGSYWSHPRNEQPSRCCSHWESNLHRNATLGERKNQESWLRAMPLVLPVWSRLLEEEWETASASTAWLHLKGYLVWNHLLARFSSNNPRSSILRLRFQGSTLAVQDVHAKQKFH
jgi:hypothetical protein